MDDMLKKIQDYLDNTSDEELLREWNQKAYLDEIGPDAFEYVSYAISCFNKFYCNSSNLKYDFNMSNSSVNSNSEYFFAA